MELINRRNKSLEVSTVGSLTSAHEALASWKVPGDFTAVPTYANETTTSVSRELNILELDSTIIGYDGWATITIAVDGDRLSWC